MFFSQCMTALLFTQGRLPGGTVIPNNSDLILIQYKDKKVYQKLEKSKAMCLVTEELGYNRPNSGKKNILEKV